MVHDASPLSFEHNVLEETSKRHLSGLSQQSVRANGQPRGVPEAIDITLRPSAKGWSTRIHYRRPDPGSLVVGRDSTTARKRLGLVHSVCRYAHEVGFARATENTGQGTKETIARRDARNLLLTIDAAMGHTRRVALELATVGNGYPAVSELRYSMDIAAMARKAVGMDGLDGPVHPDKSLLKDGLWQLKRSTGAVLRAVAPEPPSGLLKHLSPTIRASVVRGWRRPWRYVNGLLQTALWLAERLEAEACLSSARGLSGTGHGRAITSRGMLRYAISLQDGLVTACHASTPTGRMTAPDGLLSRQLSQLPNNDYTEALARLVVLAADPCAPASIKLMEATDA